MIGINLNTGQVRSVRVHIGQGLDDLTVRVDLVE